MSTDAREQFDRTAAGYAISRAHFGSESLRLLKGFASDRRFGVGIDIATGPGFTAFALADQCDEMIATDISGGMLEQVEKLVGERGIVNVSRSFVDAHALPFADSSLDLVMCRTAPHHFKSIPTFLAEAHRVLSDSGLLLLVDTTTSEDGPAREWHQEMEWRRDGSHVAAPTPSGWRAAVREAGFEIVDEGSTTVDMTFNDWVLRSKMPVAEAEAMRAEWAEADEGVAGEFLVRDPGDGDFSFSWPVIVLACVVVG
jgi:SAM-dependent methyltransferase